jgi:hypothetical protein
VSVILVPRRFRRSSACPALEVNQTFVGDELGKSQVEVYHAGNPFKCSKPLSVTVSVGEVEASNCWNRDQRAKSPSAYPAMPQADASRLRRRVDGDRAAHVFAARRLPR